MSQVTTTFQVMDSVINRPEASKKIPHISFCPHFLAKQQVNQQPGSMEPKKPPLSIRLSTANAQLVLPN
jgi:hypothetical protein